MKKYIIHISIVIIALSAALSCKKPAGNNYVMTVRVNGDSVWTTHDVVSENDNNIAYIDGYNGSYSVSLGLTAYEPGDLTYNIGLSGDTLNTNMCSAIYSSPASAVTAEAGSIAITSTGANTISGTFNFTENGINVSGSFTAPRP